MSEVQINFSDETTLPGFPKQGILTIYSMESDCVNYNHGFDKTSQKNCRALYFHDVIKDSNHLHTDFSFLDDMRDETAFTEEAALRFEVQAAQ